jgi:hypothetical protein
MKTITNMLKKTLISLGVCALLPVCAMAQNGTSGQTGAWLPTWADALGAAAPVTLTAGTTNGSVFTAVTNAPKLSITPNAYMAFYPSFNLASAGASISNVTFYFSVGPGTYTNGAGSISGSTNMTTTNLAITASLALTGSTNAIGQIVINPTNLIGTSIQFIGAANYSTNAGGVTISNMAAFSYKQQ